MNEITCSLSDLYEARINRDHAKEERRSKAAAAAMLPNLLQTPDQEENKDDT